MKKLYFFIAALAVSVAFTSCGNSKKQSEKTSTTEQIAQKIDASKALYVEEILKMQKMKWARKLL